MTTNMASDELTSTSSTVSLGLADPNACQANAQNNFSPLPGPLTSDKFNPLADACSLAIYSCSMDRILLCSNIKSLTPGTNNSLFLPTVWLKKTDCLAETAQQVMNLILDRLQFPSSAVRLQTTLLEISRMQWPKKGTRFLERYLYGVVVDDQCVKASTSNKPKVAAAAAAAATVPSGDVGEEFKRRRFNKTLDNISSDGVITTGLIWYGENDMLREKGALWGSEPFDALLSMRDYWQTLVKSGITTTSEQGKTNLHRSLTEDDLGVHKRPISLVEFSLDDALLFLTPLTDTYRKERELLLSARFTVEETTKLYNEYLSQCWPATVMTICSFRMFMNKLGWMPEEEMIIRMLFKSYYSVALNPNADPSIREYSIEESVV